MQQLMDTELSSICCFWGAAGTGPVKDMDKGLSLANRSEMNS